MPLPLQKNSSDSTPNSSQNTQNIGRFAPSPTGHLHLGSLITAVASYCHIHSLKTKKDTAGNFKSSASSSKWFVRLEDTDIQRCQQQFSDSILLDLESLGLYWDDEVLYQSKRTDIYNDYIETYLKPITYPCSCSRKKLTGAVVYPRYCLAPDTALNRIENKLRIQLPDYAIGFMDGIQDMQWQNPQKTLGDMVIRRDNRNNSLNMLNFILAVSIDDGLQKVSHIMRGLDILPMTSAQISIMQMANLPTVSQWYHLPLIINKNGQKLSKQNLAMPIDTSSNDKCSELLALALRLLNQPNVDIDSPDIMLKQAIVQWDSNALRGLKSVIDPQ